MRYRPNKESLAESLKYAVDVDGRAGLIRHLREELDGWQVDVADDTIKVSPYVREDYVSGWHDVHIVTIDGYGVMGFCEGPATQIAAMPAVDIPPCPKCHAPYHLEGAERYWEARWRDEKAENERLRATPAVGGEAMTTAIPFNSIEDAKTYVEASFAATPAVGGEREALRTALAFIDTALVADENPTMSKRAVVRIIREALAGQPDSPAVGGEIHDIADEIEQSDGIALMLTGCSKQLGIRRTAMVVAALRAQPTSPAAGGEALADKLDAHAIKYANDYGYAIATDLKNAAAALRVQPASPLRDIAEVVEECAKIAAPWQGFWLDHNSTETDREVVKVRQGIADAIRLLAGKDTPASPLLGREALAKIIYEIDPHYECGEFVDSFQVSPGGNLSWKQAKDRDAEFGHDRLMGKVTEFAYRCADAILSASPQEQPAAAKKGTNMDDRDSLLSIVRELRRFAGLAYGDPERVPVTAANLRDLADRVEKIAIGDARSEESKIGQT